MANIHPEVDIFIFLYSTQSISTEATRELIDIGKELGCNRPYIYRPCVEAQYLLS